MGLQLDLCRKINSIKKIKHVIDKKVMPLFLTIILFCIYILLYLQFCCKMMIQVFISLYREISVAFKIRDFICVPVYFDPKTHLQKKNPIILTFLACQSVTSPKIFCHGAQKEVMVIRN